MNRKVFLKNSWFIKERLLPVDYKNLEVWVYRSSKLLFSESNESNDAQYFGITKVSKSSNDSSYEKTQADKVKDAANSLRNKCFEFINFWRSDVSQELPNETEQKRIKKWCFKKEKNDFVDGWQFRNVKSFFLFEYIKDKRVFLTKDTSSDTATGFFVFQLLDSVKEISQIPKPSSDSSDSSGEDAKFLYNFQFLHATDFYKCLTPATDDKFLIKFSTTTSTSTPTCKTLPQAPRWESVDSSSSITKYKIYKTSSEITTIVNNAKTSSSSKPSPSK